MDTKFKNILHAVPIVGKCWEDYFDTCLLAMPLPKESLYAALAESGSAGAGSHNTANSEPANAQENKKKEEALEEAPERKRENAPSGIANPDSPLTGDTGNTDMGQTDLGASGTGAEDPTRDS